MLDLPIGLVGVLSKLDYVSLYVKPIGSIVYYRLTRLFKKYLTPDGLPLGYKLFSVAKSY